MILDGEQASDIWLLTFHLENTQKENLASTKKYTRSNLDPAKVPIYLYP